MFSPPSFIVDIANVVESRQHDEELLQALIRVLFFTIIATALLLLYPRYLQSTQILTAYSLYALFAVTHLFWVVKKPGKNRIRRFSTIVADIGFISFMIYMMDIQAIMLYPLYIWIVMGNGIRFGDRYFYLALGTAVLFMATALLLSPYWSSHTDLSAALFTGLILITLLNTKTIKRVQLLNKTLEKKVKHRVQQLEHDYLHDTLTGLQNRIALEQALKYEPFSGLIVIDIDGFRNINELYGMHTGSEILISFAGKLQAFTKSRPFVLYRIDSDVFALRATMAYIDLDFYEKFVYELFEYIEEMHLQESHRNDAIKLDVTLGISLESEDALGKAEMALSYAKAHTKKYIAYSKIIDNSKSIKQLLQRKNEIKEAIVSDNFIPVFQPIVDRNRKVVKYESLIRMRKVIDGKAQLVSPYFFLDAAVKTKQYEALTLIMIKKSFESMYEIRKPFSLNLSFNDMLNEKVLDALKSNIEKYRIGSQFTVEVLESENVEDYRIIHDFIREFKALGTEIAIDDFGSGFSNFTHVFELEPDILKIDGTLIKHIDTDAKSYEFVKSIVQLAKALNIKTLAEFVSSREIFEITYDLGIDYFQGYYFGAPMTFDELQKTLQDTEG
jgi:diguanylate cyclase (GGDEF)-like protein